MSRTSSTDFAILGLLTVEPMSGYDIRKHFSESLIYFWNESYGQIYPALKRLTKEGSIAPVAAGQSGNRERRVYSIQPKGRERLREWLALLPQKQLVRNELQLKMFLGHSAPPEALSEHIRRFRGEQEELLAMYFIIRDSVRLEHAKSPHLKYWLLCLSHGIRKCRAEINWCNEALGVLPSRSNRKVKKVASQCTRSRVYLKDDSETGVAYEHGGQSYDRR